MSSDQVLARPTPRSVNRKLIFAAVAAVLLLLPFLVHTPFVIYITTLVLMNCIGASSLHLLLRVGLMSMGQAAFLGIGSYTAVLCVMSLGLPWIIGFILAGVLTAASALVIGPVILRLRGVYFVLITFTLNEIVRLLMIEWKSLTGGPDGIYQIPPPWPAMSDPRNFYYLALVVAVVCVGFVYKLLKSDFGHAVEAIRESENLAESNGIPVYRMKIIVFAIACGLIGLQGGIQASFSHFISPDSFTFHDSLQFVVINIIGGLDSLLGPIIGTIFVTGLPEVLSGWALYQWLAYGVILILIMAYLPGGLCEIGTRIKTWVSRETRPGAQ